MTRYQIPLIEGAQSFTINLGDFQYKMTLIYRDADGGGWFLDMERTDSGDAIYGIPLLLETDLLSQHYYKNFGHLFVEMDGGLKRRPTYEDMGKTVILTWTGDEYDG